VNGLLVCDEVSTRKGLGVIERRHFFNLMAGAALLPIAAQGAGAPKGTPAAAAAGGERPLADRLAVYAERLGYDDLGETTIEKVKAHLIDTLGCGIAAFDEGPVRVCREIAQALNAGPSTIIGTNRRATPDLAAFANAAAFRYYDLNDVYVGRPSTHPSDNIAACLAVAEAERASAKDLIVAIALAYEINCRLVDALDLSDRGWDAPVFSLPAVALAAGKLMKLPADKLAHAVALAINDHIPLGQTRSGKLSDWKGLSDAEAGRNAVFAAMLARGGITGPAPIFEGKKGVFELVSGPAKVDVDAFGGRGSPFKILQCGMKAYPVVVYGQTTVLAGIGIARKIGALDRVASVEIATTKRGYQQAGSDPEKWAPASKDTADHSLPYIAARAMFDGDIGNESFTSDKMRDPLILAFMRKITVKEDPEFAKPRGNAPSTRITATLTDGQRIAHQVDSMAGFPGQPMSRADLDHKFRSNTAKRWAKQRSDAILRELWALERAGDVSSLLQKLTV
jgi:2-methylcitrate dehydratase